LQGFFVSGVWDSHALDSLGQGPEKLKALLAMKLNNSVSFSQVMPDKGQISPEYEEANRNLPNQSAG